MPPAWAKLLDFPDSPPDIWEARLPIEFEALAASLGTVLPQHNYAIIEVKLDSSIPGLLRYVLVDVLDYPLGEIHARRAATRGIIEVFAPPQPEPRQMTSEERAEVDSQEDRNARYLAHRKIWDAISFEQAHKHGQLQLLQRGFVRGIMDRLVEDLSKEPIQEEVDDNVIPETEAGVAENNNVPWGLIPDRGSDRTIVKLYCQGYTLAQIATTVHLSAKRVNNRLSELRREHNQGKELIPYKRKRRDKPRDSGI